MSMKIGVVGAGLIGSELYRRAQSLDWDVGLVLRSNGVYRNLTEKIDDLGKYQNYCKDLDVAFLAIPTLDDGKTAFDYMRSFLQKDIPVVTSEKGALSNYFSELEKWLHLIGYNATVGGGTRMLEYAKERIGPNVEQIHLVVNGTLNYTFEGVSSGRSLGEVVEETKKLGYAEPGAENPLDIINKEATEDVPMKTSIFFNICGLSSKHMRAKDVKSHKIGEPELKRLIKESNIRRYIVSITREDNEEDVIGGFKHRIDDWVISSGFKNIHENPLFLQLVPRGVNNSVLIYEGRYGIDGTYRLSGPGAGPGPTTSSMIKDAIKFLQK